MNYSNSQRAGVILYLTALLFGAYDIPFHRSGTQEILRKNPEDKKETVGGVRDDEVWEDGMGMAAGTGKAQDAEAVADRAPLNKVNKRAVIVSMDGAGAFRPTAGTGLGFRTETGHEGIKKYF